MNIYHTSVLLQETLEQLKVKTGKRYIDGTLGGGGHTSEILKRGGRVLGIDVDEDALEFVRKDLGLKFNDLKIGTDLILIKENFKHIDTIAKANGFEQVTGILLDLGVSSHHLDEAERGFSFQKEGPLDMRMDKELQVKAGDLVNVLTKNELYDLFTKFGEESFARLIASHIVEARKKKRIETTTELSDIIRKAVPFSKKGINPSTKVFQALRIVVNDELDSLIELLPKAVSLLESGGRLIIISFHSLEDRIVKRAFLEFAEAGLGKIMTKKPIVPCEEEIVTNSRARSSKLRVFEKI
ncbi:MAG TPA: 16S rRNA (cytosine(1402)-N(4))-methyltransferase RsmH [Candidatus Sulfotelmatobacter sp.]|jgi:16S rRNA (cytosine1402-N4)-methyltransferase|nr:16S rRNA (cytosine(1402)-N(4))-methyltransferase RsmH [Candidatus Sulfotelmatobacter sp.]